MKFERFEILFISALLVALAAICCGLAYLATNCTTSSNGGGMDVIHHWTYVPNGRGGITPVYSPIFIPKQSQTTNQ